MLAEIGKDLPQCIHSITVDCSIVDKTSEYLIKNVFSKHDI